MSKTYKDKLADVRANKANNQPDKTVIAETPARTPDVYEAIQEWFILNDYDFKYNSIRNELEAYYKGKKMPPIDEPFMDSLVIKLNRAKVTKGKVNSATIRTVMNGIFGNENRYNPIEEYFASIANKYNPNKDGDPIKKLAATIKIVSRNSEYWEAYLKKWLVGAVAQALCQGKNELILIFTSPEEGLGKTRFFSYLCPTPLLEYRHSGQIQINSGSGKDINSMLPECFLINIDDQLDTSSFKDLGALKTFITLEDINQREAYAKNRTRRPRRASFCATVNSRQFLTEDKNRRYFVFEPESINHEQIAKIDIDLVWSFAYYLLKKGENYRLNMEEIKQLNEFNDDFRESSPEEELVTKHCELLPRKSPDGKSKVDIWEYLQAKVSEAKIVLNGKKLTKALQRFGAHNEKVRIGQSVPSLYNVKFIDNFVQ